MTALNFKTIVIGLASLLFVSVAHGKCYPGLDCPEDLPGANNTPSQPVPAPSTNQQVPESAPEPEPTAAEQQPVEKWVGWKVPLESTPEESNSSSEQSSSMTKYGKQYKYSKYPK